MSGTDSEAARHFLTVGAQYYTLARLAVFAQLSPVAGNLYHHAIENILKARVSHKHTREDLKKKFGHRLAKLWDAFKQEFPAAGLHKFDDTIRKPDEWEELRYPNSMMEKRAQILFQWEPGAAPTANSRQRSPRRPCTTLS